MRHDLVPDLVSRFRLLATDPQRHDVQGHERQDRPQIVQAAIHHGLSHQVRRHPGHANALAGKFQREPVFLEDRIPRAAARLDAEQSPSIFLESDDRPLARLP